jgi:hypothetical protein
MLSIFTSFFYMHFEMLSALFCVLLSRVLPVMYNIVMKYLIFEKEKEMFLEYLTLHSA